MTEMYGLLGRQLSHSLSPEIHACLMDYEYRLFCREPEELDAFFSDDSISAFNVTIPYKIEAYGRCDVLSDTAKRTGSVNTVVRKDGRLFGYNTDYFGLEYAFDRNGINIENRKVLILGNGGASRTVQTLVKDKGAQTVTVLSRQSTPGYDRIADYYDSQIIINATPVGMFPENGNSLIDLAGFKNTEFVFDLIYNPLRTKLIFDARKLGILRDNGLTMLAAQAFRSAELFTGRKLDETLIDSTCKKVERDISNIVLTGMPGCGKSTVGSVLSGLTGNELCDTDTLIAEKEKAEIPEIFRLKGEEYFRQTETDIIREVGKNGRQVIATGGGAVLRAENREALKQNGTVIYLRRDIEKLAKEGRPLSSSDDKVRKLYLERKDIYESFADFIVDVNDSPEETAKTILKLI